MLKFEVLRPFQLLSSEFGRNGKSTRFFAWILISLVVFFAFWIRLQGVKNIPEGQFTGADPYLYYWQAQIISENGHLPERDMHRWLPLGRDLGQTLNLYSYALAITHKAIAWGFPNVSLYQVCLYGPVFFFCIGLAALCIFLYRSGGLLLSGMVGVLLATLPGTIDRSAAGFADRDAWCWMLGLLSVITYLVSLEAETPRKRLIWTLTSGFIVFVGGISWEGFGVFLSVILVVELWRFLSSETEERLGLYSLWVLCFVPTLYLASPAYRSGYGFAEHLAAFVLVPPVVILAIRSIRYLLLTKVDVLCQHARALSLGSTLVSVTLALGYVWIQHSTFADTTVPLSQTPLMQAIGELNAPDLNYWFFRYGGCFIVGSLGLLTATRYLWKRQGGVFVIMLALFCITTFFRGPLDRLYGSLLGTILFGITIASSAIGLFIFPWHRRAKIPKQHVLITMSAWFLIWSALSRDALRYDFFMGVPFAFFTAYLIQSLSNTLSRKLRASKYTTDAFRKDIPHAPLKIGIATLLLSLLMFWGPAGAYTKRTLLAASRLRPAIPGNTPPLQAFRWMKKELPDTAIVAASMGYGTQLNVIAGSKTITDPDHFIPHWIHLYYRHVCCTDEVSEALGFLKTHGATHLMLTEKDLNHNGTYAFIGGYENVKMFKQRSLHSTYKSRGGVQRLTGLKQTPFASITFDDSNPEFLKARLRTGKNVKLSYISFRENQRQPFMLKSFEDNLYGAVILYFDEHQYIENAYYIPSIGWNSLSVRLYFRGELQDVFVPVYPTDNFATASVKVWEIHYPPDIKANPKYLKTGFPEIDDHLPLQ